MFLRGVIGKHCELVFMLPLCAYDSLWGSWRSNRHRNRSVGGKFAEVIGSILVTGRKVFRIACLRVSGTISQKEPGLLAGIPHVPEESWVAGGLIGTVQKHLFPFTYSHLAFGLCDRIAIRTLNIKDGEG